MTCLPVLEGINNFIKLVLNLPPPEIFNKKNIGCKYVYILFHLTEETCKHHNILLFCKNERGRSQECSEMY